MSGTGGADDHDEPGRKLRRLRHLRRDMAAQVEPAYWRAARRSALAVLFLGSLLLLGMPLVAEQLDAVGVLGIPLGYYAMAQGCLIAVAILMLFAMRRQRDRDRRHAAPGEHGGAHAASPAMPPAVSHE